MVEKLSQGKFVRGEDGDGKVFPRFHMEIEPDAEASAKEGRPIFRDVEMVELRFAGNNLYIPDKRVTDEHRQRFPQAYAVFKNDGSLHVEGTPLKEWPAMRPSQIAEFNAMNIYTIENLAAVDDSGIQRMGMGGRMFREKARTYLELAKGNAPAERLAAEKAQLEDRLSTLQRNYDELAAAIKKMQPAESETVKTKRTA